MMLCVDIDKPAAELQECCVARTNLLSRRPLEVACRFFMRAQEHAEPSLHLQQTDPAK